MTRRKLEIPAPGEEPKVDESQISMELWVGMVLAAMVIFFGWFLWIHPQEAVPEDPFEEIDDEEERRDARDRAEFEALVTMDRLHRVDWVDEMDRGARAVELGPRQAAEEVCRQWRPHLAKGELSREANLALLQTTSRRAGHSPWSCLLKSLLSRELDPESALAAEVATFWGEVYAMTEHEEIMERVMGEILREGWSTEEESFRWWVRRCALANEYRPHQKCQRLLARQTPRHGEDYLELILLHISDDDASLGDLLLAVGSLNYLVQFGQPSGWVVESAGPVEDYDEAIQLGALFTLCRLTNAPEEMLRQQAVSALGRIAEVSNRPTNPHTQFRWRETCRYAFGDRVDPHQPVEVEGVLTVTDALGRTDYSMRPLEASGYCSGDEDLPSWYCGVERWTGDGERIRRVMSYYFAHTSYIEWYDVDEVDQP